MAKVDLFMPIEMYSRVNLSTIRPMAMEFIDKFLEKFMKVNGLTINHKVKVNKHWLMDRYTKENLMKA